MSIILPIISLIALIGLDRLTKYLAYTGLQNGPVVLIDGALELRYLENRGMAFGLLQNQRVLFIIITVVILAALVYIYTKIPAGRRFIPLKVLAVFIAAGALGNFIDRIFQGFVVDFVYISLIDFPVFNVADIYVSWSAVLLLILLLTKYKDLTFTKTKHDN